MRIDPEQSHRQIPFVPRPVGGGGDRTGGQTVIAAEHDRHRALVQRAERGLIELLTDLGNVADVFLALVAELLRLGNRRGEIAFVDDGVAKRGDALTEAGDPQCRRPHVHAAPVAAQVKRHADDVNDFHRSNFTVSDMPSADGDTIAVSSFGSCVIASRKSRISPCLLTTLWARNRPRGSSRGSTRSRNRL